MLIEILTTFPTLQCGVIEEVLIFFFQMILIYWKYLIPGEVKPYQYDKKNT